jgi:hypothetical protein
MRIGIAADHGGCHSHSVFSLRGAKWKAEPRSLPSCHRGGVALSLL